MLLISHQVPTRLLIPTIFITISSSCKAASSKLSGRKNRTFAQRISHRDLIHSLSKPMSSPFIHATHFSRLRHIIYSLITPNIVNIIETPWRIVIFTLNSKTPQRKQVTSFRSLAKFKINVKSSEETKGKLSRGEEIK
ncbi:hypothetical protein F4814DRAFT_416495 [Daldinia grandis]|nr:hypothetical protein F4814DRAFT_416495 [Daldinia grandis]